MSAPELATLLVREEGPAEADILRHLHRAARPPRHLAAGRFPGPLPAPLTTDTLCVLRHSTAHYWATPKVDGTRAMYYQCRRGLYLVDRGMVVYRKRVDDPHGDLRPQTILDGEVALAGLHFLAFDCLLSLGRTCVALSLLPRMEALRRCVAEDTHGGFLATKPLVRLDRLGTLPATLAFPTDGLIIMRESPTCGYHFRPAHSLLKWKPSPTIDVRVDPADEEAGGIPAYAADDEKVALLLVRADPLLSMAAGARIVECRYSDSAWWIQRLRPDKVRPNSTRTIKQTMALVLGDVPSSREALVSALAGGVPQTVAAMLVDLMLLPWLRETTLELELRLWTPGGLSERTFASLLAAMERRAAETAGWRREASHTVDTCYDDGTRYTYEGAVLVAVAHKTTLKTRNLRLLRPVLGTRYSLRATLKREQPSTGPTDDRGPVRSRRNKQRTRFLYLDTYAFDFTRVENSTRTSYEIEVELLSRVAGPALLVMEDMLRYTLGFLLRAGEADIEMT